MNAQEAQTESKPIHEPDRTTPYLPDSRKARHALDLPELAGDEQKGGMAAAAWMVLAALLTMAVLVTLAVKLL